jgi:predicted  nucleic acid-binding Zn-ribbon protein
MAYKCVHCSKVYEDNSGEVISGCSGCHSKFFFYIKDDKLKEIEKRKELNPELNSSEKKQMEKDVRDIANVKDSETPVFLDFESIKIMKPGKYLLDISKLFSMDRPRIYTLEDGKYVVDLTTIASKKKGQSI